METSSSVGDLPTPHLPSLVLFYGNFINAVISFLAIAFGVFLVVKAYMATKAPPVEADSGLSEVDLLTQIRDELRSRS